MGIIYLDNAATTAMPKEVEKAMLPYFSEKFGNPSSRHAIGQEARKALEQAKTSLAKEIGAKPWEIILTSGGTESNNLALFGAAGKSHKRKIIISSIEHSSVYEPSMELRKRGYNVVIIPVNSEGLIDINKLEKEVDSNTLLVSVMHVNSETGITQDIYNIGKICRRRGILFHTDALQSYGKLRIDVHNMNIDLLSAAAHKIGGPKGIGFLYVRDRTKIEPILYGGHQERGLRSGTENVAGAVGFAAALKVKRNEGKTRIARDYFVSQIKKLGGTWNGNIESTIYSHAHVSFLGYSGEAMVSYLSDKGIMCSTGSACDIDKDEKRVLKALGMSHNEIRGSVRFVFNDSITKQDVNYTISKIKDFMKIYRDKL